MNRLRVRVELNRRKTGVPMEELVSVVEETRKFFHLLAEDVQIEAGRGEWLASNFDPESLNFTAEYNGTASTEQIHAFGSAFGGATSLRRETIAQFTHIADFIGEDELVGFGLYQSDHESEPSDWRCLSKRDALRFADEIRLLAKATGESEAESPLPAVMNGSVGGRRLFKDRREREAIDTDPSKWIRDVESTLAKRIALLEGKVEKQAGKIQGLGDARDIADERFIKLLGAMESFWSQAPRQLAAPEKPLLVAPKRPPRWWKFGLAFTVAALMLVAMMLIAMKPSEIEHQWSRWSKSASPPSVAEPASVISTPPVAIITPAAAPAQPVKQPQADAGAQMTQQIFLEIPPPLRSLIESQVLVNVAVGIDPEGKVKTAEIASIKGEGAGLLADDALRAARWFRFRPTRQGTKAVASRTVLTFVFNPDSGAPQDGSFEK